jgi:hypothetical protein
MALPEEDVEEQRCRKGSILQETGQRGRREAPKAAASRCVTKQRLAGNDK